MINLKAIAITAGVLLVASCVPTTTKDSQYIAVDTKNQRHAICTLTNAHGTWQVDSTPGSVIIDRDSSDLKVSCIKGNLSGEEIVRAKMKGTLLQNESTGEINAVVVNPTSHHSHYYPEKITVDLKAGKMKTNKPRS